MRRVGILLSKEVKSYFTSPLVYLFSALYIFVLGYLFYNLLYQYVEASQLPPSLQVPTNFLSGLLRPFFGWINLISALFIPFITMRLFAEEKKQHTLELLLTSPMSEWEIILAKWGASFVVMLFMLALTTIFPVILLFSGMDYGIVIFTSYLGMMLNILSYLILGILASVLTENQILAAVMGLVLVLGSMLITWISQISVEPMVGDLIRYVGILPHFEAFSLGAIKTTDLVYYFSIFFFTGLLTKETLQARNW